MHEISLMEQTLAIALEYAQHQGVAKIHALKMRVGELSGVVPTALEFAFEVITKGSIAADATLAIEPVAVTCYCTNCQIDFAPTDFIYECPCCHDLSTQIVTGKEIELTSLEVS